MKYFIAIVLIAAVALAKPRDLHGLTESQLAEVHQIMEAIYSPSTDPTTAVMLEQMLGELLGLGPVQTPVHIPAIIDQFEPIHIGPAIIDDFHPVDISPELVDFPVFEGADAAIPAQAPSSPLVQIIVNVNQADAVSPVQLEQSEVKPTPVHVVDSFDPIPEPVLIGDLPESVAVAPIIIAPAVVIPDTLN